ncbi:MAG: hypothetical protein D6832_05565 [Alphaproteobacteria bacterium]|nr:MAG: hypothetical protein D6832_05565 [Alphaproteobacteria bacterium]
MTSERADPRPSRRWRGWIAAAALALAGCAADTGPEAPPELPPLGDFRLGYVVVVADKAELGPLSRDLPRDQIAEALKTAIEERLRPYDGPRYYHVSVAVGAFILARPGIPLVAQPKSMMVIEVNLWDDARGGKILEEPKQFVIIEPLRHLVIGSGLTMTAEEQMRELARIAARQIHEWMAENAASFFPPEKVYPPRTGAETVPPSAASGSSTAAGG